MTYWRPQIMRHSEGEGRIEYAFHDVYFHNSTVTSYTLHARSDRKATVAELESWVRSKLIESKHGIACGDLGYTHTAEDLALWLKHVADPPIDFVPERQ